MGGVLSAVSDTTPCASPPALPRRSVPPASDRLQADRRAARLAVADLLHLSPRPSLPVFLLIPTTLFTTVMYVYFNAFERFTLCL